MKLTATTQPTTRTAITAADAFVGPLKSGKAASQHDRLVEQTRKWVAQSFYGELLKQARNGPFKSDLFGGGRGGEAFQSLQDQQMAEQMARGAGNKLVKAIVRRIEASTAYANQKRAKDVQLSDLEKRLNGPRAVEPASNGGASNASDAAGSMRTVRTYVAPVH